MSWGYFVGTILQFQLHSSLCRVARQYNPSDPYSRPLHKCDLYKSKELCPEVMSWGYFVGTILQFQLHSSLCRVAGQYNPSDPYSRPLHKCDLYKSKEAGNLLSRMMSLGSSVPWQDALREATGESKMNGTHLREYFRPLEEWLRQENLRTQEFVGWTYDGDYCKQSIETANLQVYGGYYNTASLVPMFSAAALAVVSLLLVLM
ncbi:unnamed protein product [Timema podura]|uniref:Angiotensin-converting enzyme n=1 Tax=Timema podura TaxID=61482 RepID=A0ABN7NXR4_TIMPD|nr:unnamed protein product [Timema podura]